MSEADLIFLAGTIFGIVIGIFIAWVENVRDKEKW